MTEQVDLASGKEVNLSFDAAMVECVMISCPLATQLSWFSQTACFRHASRNPNFDLAGQHTNEGKAQKL